MKEGQPSNNEKETVSGRALARRQDELPASAAIKQFESVLTVFRRQGEDLGRLEPNALAGVAGSAGGLLAGFGIFPSWWAIGAATILGGAVAVLLYMTLSGETRARVDVKRHAEQLKQRSMERVEVHEVLKDWADVAPDQPDQLRLAATQKYGTLLGIDTQALEGRPALSSRDEDPAPSPQGTPYRLPSLAQDDAPPNGAPTDGDIPWTTTNAEWIRFNERVSFALDVAGRRSADSMPPHAWTAILEGPKELAKNNLETLSYHLSGLDGWNAPIANTRGHLKAYEIAVEKLGRLKDDVEKEDLEKAFREVRQALSALKDGLITLASQASSPPP